MFVLLPRGQEAGITGTTAAAWNDNCLGHGGYSWPGEEGEGKKRVERGRERDVVFTAGLSILCSPRNQGRGSHCVLSI